MGKAAKQGPPVQFRAADLDQQFNYRGEAGRIAKRDLQRYYRLLQQELSRVRFTEAEALLMCEVAVMMDSELDAQTWQNLADSAERAVKRHVNLDVLVARLRDPGLRLAVTDAIERFWRLPADLDQTVRLTRVGLLTPQWLELKEATAQVMAAHRAMVMAEATGANAGAERQAFADAEARVQRAEDAVEADIAAHGRS